MNSIKTFLTTTRAQAESDSVMEVVAAGKVSLPLCLSLIEKMAETLQEIADEGHLRDCAECWQAKCDCVLPVARECLQALDEMTEVKG